ncbi:MAG: hypothetical protein Q9173_007353, partial [Seirophora scorigena]
RIKRSDHRRQTPPTHGPNNPPSIPLVLRQALPPPAQRLAPRPVPRLARFPQFLFLVTDMLLQVAAVDPLFEEVPAREIRRVSRRVREPDV